MIKTQWLATVVCLFLEQPELGVFTFLIFFFLFTQCKIVNKKISFFINFISLTSCSISFSTLIISGLRQDKLFEMSSLYFLIFLGFNKSYG